MANKTTELLNFAISLEVDKADVAKSIREISNVTAALDLLVKKGEINEEQAKQLALAYSNLNTQLENVEGALEKSTGAYTKANAAQNKLLGAQQRATVSTKGFANATNNANQIMFSFGDAIQDGAQFQFGFAQGARAIGNNLAFAAEQFVYVNQKAGGYKNTLKALLKSFWGPAGIILAINTAITIITVWGDKLFESKKRTQELKDELDDLSDEVKSVFKGFDSIGEIEGLDRVSNSLLEVNNLLESIQILRNDIAGTKGQSGYTKVGYERLRNTLQKQLEKNKKDIEELDPLLRNLAEGQSDALKERIKLLKEEAEQRELIRILIAKSLTDEDILLQAQKARDEFKVEAAKNPILDDEIDASFDLDLGAKAGTIAFDLDVLKDLQFDYNNAVTQAEREALAERIKLKEEEIATKKGLLKEEKDFTFKFYADIASIGTNLASIAFGKNKAIASAAALVDTYLAAQKAYTSQLTPDPTSLVRAQIAAAAAIASGLARVASINRTQIGSTGGGSASSGGGQQVSNANSQRSTFGRFGSQLPLSRNQPVATTTVIVQGLKDKEFAFATRRGEKSIRKEQF